MSDPGDAIDRPLGRGLQSSAKRAPALLTHGPIAPWHATVKVTPVQLRRGPHFEVYAEWTGPPQEGFPRSDRPVSASDTYLTADVGLAKAIAARAEEAFRAAIEPPDLRAIAREFKARLAAGPYG